MVTIADAAKVARFLEAELSPVAILLFGSVARSGEGDDLDILIVTDQEDMHETVGMCLHEYGKQFPIDYFVASTRLLNEHFRKGSPFLNLIQDEGRILYMKSTLNEWIDLAREDLHQANYLIAGHFYRGACFAAQQSLEKGLKAALIRKGWKLDKIHHIRRLLGLCEEYGVHIDWRDEDVDLMDSIYRGRYPAEEGLLPLKHPDQNEASRAITIAGGLLQQLGLWEEN
ncbi:MAG: HEPN domain-containing protein [Desulfatirhabdiaceae bacterium]